MPPEHSFYWHDYETFGADPASDRPAQFAGLRTDAQLREIDEPLVVYCRPPPDYLPHPEACLITGITPQIAAERGLTEREFITRINAEFMRPGTCGVGYNSIRFDDEFTRHALYRNFFDPYAREWRNGNSRWDLIDVLRMARALRPEGIAWPDHPDGRPSFRLEDLARANGIEHGNAHDALADVRATLALARLLRDCQPKLFEYALRARDKNWVRGQLDYSGQKPLLHVSARFPAENGNMALVLPLAQHPAQSNKVIVCNLLLDPSPLERLDAPRLREYLYTPSAELPADMGRVPLKELHLNRSPMIAPPAMLTPDIAARYGIDLAACEANRRRVCAIPGLRAKLGAVYAEAAVRATVDPELALYGSFLPDIDRPLLERVRACDGAALAGQSFPFEDARLHELLFRYRARNFPDSLDAGERARWREHCEERLHRSPLRGGLDCQALRERVAALRAERATDARAQRILDAVAAWGEQRCRGD
ncbi:MAG: Exodeoxyribonuclease I [Pseudomonadales bacterium]|nr:Exodeoxyribonuclease I [Pseudomonadales bacterium]